MEYPTIVFEILFFCLYMIASSLTVESIRRLQLMDIVNESFDTPSNHKINIILMPFRFILFLYILYALLGWSFIWIAMVQYILMKYLPWNFLPEKLLSYRVEISFVTIIFGVLSLAIAK